MMDVHSSVHRPMLSVVAPCFNEEACLPRFLDRVIAACQTSANGSHEIYLVNDGSTDNTWECIRAMALARPGVVDINLSRNHGHQLAVTAGLSQAKGERVLVIAADLQDPPELLGEMMARMGQAFDVEYGRRRARAGEGGFKRATAHIICRLLGRVSDVAIPMDTGDFRLLSRSMVEWVNAMPEQDRFLRGNFLSHCVWDTCEAILDACCDAWNAPIATPDAIASTGTNLWRLVSEDDRCRS